MMRKRLLAIAALLCALSLGLKAQDHPVTVLDGPDLRVDSLSVDTSSKPAAMPMLAFPRFSMMLARPTLLMPPIETKEQRAARINQRTFDAVTLSIDQGLYWHRVPTPPKEWYVVLAAARLFLSNPYAFPEGCVPLMNASFPFIYAKTPGMAPYDNPYTSDQFPKCIESEYDFATGTYKQVMVDWTDFQKNMSKSYMERSVQPIPAVPVTPVERFIAH